MVDRKVAKLIRQYLEAIKSKGINLNKAILYGSYAKNEARRGSDIDLMLVSSQFDESDEQYMGIIWSTTRLSNFLIEPVAIGLKRYETDNISPLIQVAKREGVEIKLD